MKKTLVSALTTALVVGAASTTFAASNPFSDVPADHWAYDAVSQLAADGVIEGYGDGTYKGNRNITRYEMAQMVAKAMAKNTSGADKALVDKLAAEFAEELNNLGVRVSNLERNADMVKWNGKAEYTFQKNRYKFANGNKQIADTNQVVFRLEPVAEVNDHWHVKARLDATQNLDNDTDNNNVRLRRVWAQGDYGKFQVKLGKFSGLNDDSFADTTFSGVEASYGSDVKGIVGIGRLNADNTAFSSTGRGIYWDAARGRVTDNTASDYRYVGVEATKGKATGSITWHNVANYNLFDFKNNGTATREANIFGFKGGYTFSKNVAANGWYTFNNNADRNQQKQAAALEVDYKGAQKENKGTWGAWVAYRHIGQNAIISNTYDVIEPGEKGFEIGGNYTVFKNVVATLRYGHNKAINTNWGSNLRGNNKSDKFFGRVEFFF